MARTKDFDEDEVLQKAIRLFWHKGYHATSMQDIVEALGISRSSIYDTYTDKHSLFIKALENYRHLAAEKMLRTINETPDTKQAIKKLFKITTTELTRDEQCKGCFLVNAAVEVAPHDDEVNAIVRQNEHDIEQAFFEAIKRGQKNGEISTKNDSRALARFIFNTVTGIRVAAKSGADGKVYDDIVRVTMSVLD